MEVEEFKVGLKKEVVNLRGQKGIKDDRLDKAAEIILNGFHINPEYYSNTQDCKCWDHKGSRGIKNICKHMLACKLMDRLGLWCQHTNTLQDEHGKVCLDCGEQLPTDITKILLRSRRQYGIHLQ